MHLCSVFNILSNIFTYYNDNSKSCTSACQEDNVLVLTGSSLGYAARPSTTIKPCKAGTSEFPEMMLYYITLINLFFIAAKNGKTSVLAPKRKESIRHCHIARIQGHWWIRDSSMAFGIEGDIGKDVWNNDLCTKYYKDSWGSFSLSTKSNGI